MTYAEVIKAAIPNADAATVDYILWNRTPYPMGKVTARSLYAAASRWRRAGGRLCELCDNLTDDDWCCTVCAAALANEQEP